jgi:hypothetical protein
MATTPNYSWVMPDPTDFVTDLPADFEIFGDAVDATVDGIETIANAALPETIIDAAGDLIYGSAADTAARLAIGTVGQVLTVNSGATAPEWAAPAGAAPNGYTLLNAGGTALTGAATITVSGISGQRSLLIRVQGASSVSGSSYIGIRVNADSGGNYDVGFFEFGATANNFNNASASTEIWLGQMSNNAGSVVGGSVWLDGTNTTSFKALTAQGMSSTGGGSGQLGFVHGGIYKGTSAITSVSAISNSGNFDAGTLFVYGAAI